MFWEALFLKRLAFAARFQVRPRIHAVDRTSQDTGTGGLAHPARPAEQECLGKMPVPDGVLERDGDGLLPHHGIECLRPVFSSRNDEIQAFCRSFRLGGSQAASCKTFHKFLSFSVLDIRKDASLPKMRRYEIRTTTSQFQAFGHGRLHPDLHSNPVFTNFARLGALRPNTLINKK